MPSLTKWHAIWIAVAAGICLIASISAWRRHAMPPGPVRVTAAASSLPVPRSGTPGQTGEPVYVHVAGQVLKPGLYRLAAGARVMDAITTAGGASPQADLDAINLATPLHDGQKLIVPALGQPGPPPQQEYVLDSPAREATATPSASSPVPLDRESASVALPDDGTSLTSEDIPAAVSSTSRSTKFKHPGDGAVDINTSTAVELQRLPGVGPATARKIIEYRAEHDGFKTIEELMEVKGIGPAKLRKMKPFVVLRERGE